MSQTVDDNTISDLRSELFATVRALRGEQDPAKVQMEINRAKAVGEVAGRIIDSVKAETDYVRAFGGRGAVPASGFIGKQSKPDTLDQQARQIGTASTPVPGNGLPPRAPTGTL